MLRTAFRRQATISRLAALPQGQATFTKARGVLADVAHHSDHAIRVAARTVIMFSDDDHEARQFWLVVNATRPDELTFETIYRDGMNREKPCFHLPRKRATEPQTIQLAFR